MLRLDTDPPLSWVTIYPSHLWKLAIKLVVHFHRLSYHFVMLFLGQSAVYYFLVLLFVDLTKPQCFLRCDISRRYKRKR